MTDSVSQRALWHPRYIPVWALAGLLWLLSRLPWQMQVWLGRRLGDGLYLLGRRRRRVAQINLALCFPQWSETARQQVLRGHFQALGIASLELANAWWGTARTYQWLERHSQIEGLEHVQAALAHGKGALLLSAHFTSLELTGRLLLARHPIAVMYRKHQNPAVECLFARKRRQYCLAAIRRDDAKGVLRALNANQAVWYAPDQAYRARHSVLAPFFGVPAATHTATSRLAKISGAPVLPFFAHRLPNGGYHLRIGAPLAQFPGNDVHADAARINALIEQAILAAPEQYLWTHRRFKYRHGQGLPDYYHQ
ncbi:LpxL/LpxP family Kdo(2)-lipid IV(A) lauroyl/palmitoleoyl acyltransferase [Thiorhodospira sibirica]|uniref:LpxL/LpxP family Kdo(2)-lipid IV(A) lauroyl/palmitoleoyl acyltransferase n=1 Tax=Thiorhodospira sibirica TaxID=154347 RepID=UPI00022C1D74|nr:LpxL/LpxP family Kdo(2)-lipid IV(A) lauroyl/palmitoleoyl acyltransferase [Thiorhodospira sibirica]